jgi:hypothetical protein
VADLSVLVQRVAGRSAIMPMTTQNLSRAVDSENVEVYANFITIIRGNTGQVAFNANPVHAVVTNYTLRVRVYGNSTVIDTQDLGVPTPDGNNVIVVDASATFAEQSAGNYTVSILTTTAGGSTDSSESAPFALPLS